MHSTQQRLTEEATQILLRGLAFRFAMSEIESQRPLLNPQDRPAANLAFCLNLHDAEE